MNENARTDSASADSAPGEAVEGDELDGSVADRVVRQMKGFADGTRLRILYLLRDGELCVHEIVDALEMSQSAVSHQLRVLRNADLVSDRREGRHVYYELADAHVREMLENAISHGAEGS